MTVARPCVRWEAGNDDIGAEFLHNGFDASEYLVFIPFFQRLIHRFGIAKVGSTPKVLGGSIQSAGGIKLFSANDP